MPFALVQTGSITRGNKVIIRSGVGQNTRFQLRALVLGANDVDNWLWLTTNWVTGDANVGSCVVQTTGAFGDRIAFTTPTIPVGTLNLVGYVPKSADLNSYTYDLYRYDP